MKTLDGIIEALEEMVSLTDADSESEGYYLAMDSLHYLKAYRKDLQKKCKNCEAWHGRDSYDPNDPWREEYFCGYETWTYPEDSCSRWEKMDEKH